MSDIKVGRTPMKYVKTKSRDKRCTVCGAYMVEEVAKPERGQLKDDAKARIFHQVKVYCPHGHKGGWKHG